VSSPSLGSSPGLGSSAVLIVGISGALYWTFRRNGWL